MRSFRPRCRRQMLAALVIGVAASLFAPVPPAAGGITTLCTGYRGCAAEGKGSAGYAQANDRTYWRMLPGNNCTNYAAYRMVRRGMANVRPWSGPGNATYWGPELARRTDDRPRVGSIAWWRAGPGRGGSTGHLAYVERVVSRSEIVVSQDSWGGDFSWARVTKGSGWPDGFIHLRDAELRAGTRPSLLGSSRRGQVLEVRPGTAKPGGSVAWVRWMRNGQPVKGAEGRRYRLGRADLGSRVQAKVRYRRDGYVGLTSLTARTRPVRTTPRISTTVERRRYGVRLEVVGRGARRPLTTGVAVTHRGRIIARETMRRGTAVLPVAGLRPGRRTLQIRVRTTPFTTAFVVTRVVRIRR